MILVVGTALSVLVLGSPSDGLPQDSVRQRDPDGIPVIQRTSALSYDDKERSNQTCSVAGPLRPASAFQNAVRNQTIGNQTKGD